VGVSLAKQGEIMLKLVRKVKQIERSQVNVGNVGLSITLSNEERKREKGKNTRNHIVREFDQKKL